MGVVIYRENEEQSKRIVFRLFDVKLILLLPTTILASIALAGEHIFQVLAQYL